MAFEVKDGGVWKAPDGGVWAKQSGVWEPVTEVHAKDAGTWKKVWPTSTIYTHTIPIADNGKGMMEGTLSLASVPGWMTYTKIGALSLNFCEGVSGGSFVQRSHCFMADTSNPNIHTQSTLATGAVVTLETNDSLRLHPVGGWTTKGPGLNNNNGPYYGHTGFASENGIASGSWPNTVDGKTSVTLTVEVPG